MSLTNVIRNDFWDTDGSVHAILATNGVVFVGGSFSHVAPRIKKVAAVHAYTSEPIPSFPAITGGNVAIIVPDENGGWYLGGDFTAVGGVSRTNLAHLYSDFSVDPIFAPNPNGTIRTLLLDGAALFVGGSFSEISGQNRSRLAALDAGNGAAHPWNPGADDDVLSLQVLDDTIYVGGRFGRLGGQTRQRLAAVTRDGALLPWAPQLNGDVFTIGVNDDAIFVGGNFSFANGSARGGLAAFNRVTGQLVSSWNPNPRDGLAPGSVTTVRVVCNTVYVAGRFTSIGGFGRSRVAAVDSNTGQVLAWDARLSPFRSGTLPSSVQVLEVSGSTVFIGGEFNAAAGTARRDLLAVDSVTGTLMSWNPGLDGGIVALGVVGRVLLAAVEIGPGGVERRNVAAFDEMTGRALNWSPNPDDSVLALAFAGDTLFIGGSFSNVGGLPRGRLAAVDANTGVVRTDWVVNANSNVQALALSGNRLFVGGSFTTLTGITRRGLAAVDADTGLLVPGWSPHADGGDVRALAEANGTLFVGGSFAQIAFIDRSRLAAVSSASGAVLPWNPGADGNVRALLLAGGAVYVGGQFTTVAGQTVPGLAALNVASGQAIPWILGSPSIPPDVRALAISGSVIYLGGGVLELGVARRFGVAAVLTNGTVLPWNPGSSDRNVVNSLGLSDRAAYAGGAPGLLFEGAESKRSAAAFPQVGSPGWLVQPEDVIVSQGASVTMTATAASALPLTYQWRFNGIDLPGETGSSYVQTNAQVNGEGIYEVTASNPLGAITAQASLRVFAPVQILSQPSAVFTTSGSNVTLFVTAIGNPPPLFQWRLNGVLIPGAVQSTQLLVNATPQSGGIYSVAVANSTGTLLSESVSLTILTNNATFSDSFANRGSIFGASGTVRGANIGATREDGSNEPRHAGKRGGASVWLKWTAPANGIATFSTRGSGFDTLLGIYTNSTLASLLEVASDEDRGGFLTSRASINAVAGREYQIAIDGLGGAVGNIVLSWETEANTSLPVITAPPLSQSISPGDTALFSVSVFSPGAVRYQWFFGCQALSGETNATLTLTNAQSRQAGLYRVMIVDQAGRVADSLPAALEIGLFDGGRSFPKLDDLIVALSGTGGGGFIAASPGGVPLFLLSLGTPLSHTFSTSTNSPSLLIAECDVVTGGAAFLSFSPNQNGVVLIDTIGSSFDTVLSVFNYVDPLHLASNLLGCDNDGAPDRVRSVLRLATTGGRQYLVRVSGVSGAIGRARVNWNLGTPPGIVQSNSALTAYDGGAFALDAGVATGGLPTSYQWYRNGERLVGWTNSVLELSAITTAMGGTYSVIVSNFAGVVTNLRAYVEVRLPLRLTQTHWNAEGKFSFAATGHPNDPFVIESCATLANSGSWSLLLSSRIPVNGQPVYFTDPEPPASSARYYRIRPSPPASP